MKETLYISGIIITLAIGVYFTAKAIDNGVKFVQNKTKK